MPSLLLLLVSCRKEKRDASPTIEEEINLTGFSRIHAGDKFNVVITKGEDFYIKVKGPANDVHDMEFSVANTILDIRFGNYVKKRPRIDIFITMPTVASVSLAGAAHGTVNGFQDEPHVIKAILSGASECKFNGTGSNMQIEISGGSKLDVTGTTASLYGNLSGGAKLNAYNLNSTEVDIEASGGSVAYVKVTDVLFATASGGSRIYYKGNPVTKNIETSGGGAVIQE